MHMKKDGTLKKGAGAEIKMKHKMIKMQTGLKGKGLYDFIKNGIEKVGNFVK